MGVLQGRTASAQPTMCQFRFNKGKEDGDNWTCYVFGASRRSQPNLCGAEFPFKTGFGDK